MPEIPIRKTDLTALVDDEVAARLEVLNQPGPNGEKYAGYYLILRRGDVHLICERYRIELPLKRWITGASGNRWVVFVNGFRRDFCDGNLGVIDPSEEYAVRKARPALERREPIDPRFAWIPELQGYVRAWYGKPRARKPGQKGSLRPRWKNADQLVCYSSEQALADKFQRHRADRLDEVNEDLQREKQRQKDRVQAARKGAGVLAAKHEFIPLGPWLSAEGKAWVGQREPQSAFLVMFGLQYRRTVAMSDSFLVDYADLEPKLGLNPVAIAKALRYLESAGDISTEPRKDHRKSQGIKGRFSKNLQRGCSFTRASDADQCTGRFPMSLFADPVFQQFEVTAKGRTRHGLPARDRSALVALYLMAKGRQNFEFFLPDLMCHAGFHDKTTARKALESLHQQGLLTEFTNPCVNPKVPYEKTLLHVSFRVWV